MSLEQTVIDDHSNIISSPQTNEEFSISSVVSELIQKFGRTQEALIPILQEIQNRFRYLPQPILQAISENTEIKLSELLGVATFYSQFRLKPIGRHKISVCVGTACHVKGASLVLDAFRQELKLAQDEDTDAQKLWTIEKVACLGCCTLAPVVVIDNRTYGHVSPSNVREILDDFLARSQKSEPKPQSQHFISEDQLGEIRIGLGSCCQAQGSKQIYDSILDIVQETNLPILVKPVGCIGMCHQVPLMETISKQGNSSYFARVQPDEVRSIFQNEYRSKSWISRIKYNIVRFLEYCWSDEIANPVQERQIELDKKPVCSFLERQKRLATETCGLVNPTDLDEYIHFDGFSAFRRVLTMSNDEIIQEMKIAGLRGRGGAGFPTFRKWDAVRQNNASQKYIVCNGDEGDPGAFMDRMILESFPFRVLEGMMIAAKTISASQGFLYIRAEYPLAVQRIKQAIRILEERHFLGDHILGSDFALSLQVKEGAGAFVCGEETALLESIEGRRGMPRLRPPFPAQRGLWNQPTLVNNVETYSLVPWIFRHSGADFAVLGTEKSSGTKVFALAGKIQRGGLIEVPMGISIRTIVEDIGGGVANNKKFKAVQIGGPSGGCVPAELADTSVDFESLSKVGAIMGSGGLVVLDEDDCMVDIARYFLQFTQEQSCGKCTFCRIGTRRMLEILNRLCSGQGQKDDIQKLEKLAKSIQSGSLCGLGKTAPNPVLSTIRYFRKEYEAHLDGVCPSGKCRELIEYRINSDSCNGCSLCSGICPTQAIESRPYRKHEITQEKCTKCNSCYLICPHNAVQIYSGPQKDVLIQKRH
ncbi:MAG: NAD(P)H-dependent oxidoreductase subunit E [Planctomycetia bacterium]|nr:NAD(P)H-dependent oxidoreductase subunit E [Planctomycetia bacterium]